MNFSKVKMIMIGFLIAANIVIAFLCAGVYKGKFYISEREAVLAQSHLEDLGINVVFSADNLKKNSLPVYLSKAYNEEKDIPEIYTLATEVFFNKNIHKTQYVDIPEGYSVSIKNNDGETVGTSTFKDGMYFECAYEGYLTSNVIEALSQNFYSAGGTFSGGGKNEDIARKFVAKGFKKNNIDIRTLGSKEFGEGTIVYFGVFLSDKAVLDIYLNLYVVNSEIVCLCGNIPDSEIQKAYSTEMIDVIDAAYTFSELYRGNDTFDSEDSSLSVQPLKESIDISSTGLMYKMVKNNAGNYYYIPVWKFDYSDSEGNVSTAVFDALIGENKFDVN